MYKPYHHLEVGTLPTLADQVLQDLERGSQQDTMQSTCVRFQEWSSIAQIH